jgi:hypothetical protein
VLFSLSASLTHVRTDIMELYRAMGISADQLRVIEPMPMGPNYFFGFTLLSLVSTWRCFSSAAATSERTQLLSSSVQPPAAALASKEGGHTPSP